METLNIAIFPRKIITEASHVYWYSNGQMWWYMEMKDGKFHGDWKNWHSDGQQYWHRIYENGRLVKEIV